MFQKSKKLGSMLLAMAVGVSTAFAKNVVTARPRKPNLNLVFLLNY